GPADGVLGTEQPVEVEVGPVGHGLFEIRVDLLFEIAFVLLRSRSVLGHGLQPKGMRRRHRRASGPPADSFPPGAAPSRFGAVTDIVDESLPLLRHSRLTEADSAIPALDEVLEAIGPAGAATTVRAIGPAATVGAGGRGVVGVLLGLGPRQVGHLSAELVAVSAGVDVELPCHEHPADPAGAFDDHPPVAVRATGPSIPFGRLPVPVGLLTGPGHVVAHQLLP